MANQQLLIKTLATEHHLGDGELPEGFLDKLKEQGIESLDQVRRYGGIPDLAELLPEEQQVAQRIEAHADFNLISDDLQVNDQLIDAGLHSTAEIGRLPKHQFMKQAQAAGIEAKNAEMIQAKSVAVSAYLANVVTEARVAEANHRALAPLVQGDRVALFSDEPEYDERATAVSPLAYLACLLEYTKAHVEFTGSNLPANPIDGLKLSFRQPFDEMSVDEVDGKVRQVRICVEVLRSYLADLIDGGLVPEEQLNEFERQEKAYLFDAYKVLLNQFGTSYDDLRLVKLATEEGRKSLADKLGICPVHLSELYLTPSTINEQILEKLFGLQDSTRDPLSRGFKLIDSADQIASWKFSNAVWKKNTDQHGNIYIFIHKTSMKVIAQIFSDEAKEHKVASGEISRIVDEGTKHYRIQISEESNSGISGILKISVEKCRNGSAEISLIPNFLVWRLEYLRTLWQQQDWSSDPYSRGVLPIIDPDLIGPDDFRNPELSNPAFSLWVNRREDLDKLLRDNSQDFDNPQRGLDYLITQILSSQIKDLEPLFRQIKIGKNLDLTKSKLDQIGLTIERFIRLMELRATYQAKIAASDTPINSETWEDWSEVNSILTQAWKQRNLYTRWVAEEQNRQIKLEPNHFWISLHQPQEGDWPTRTHQLIDPDVLKLTDLPEPEIGNQAIAFWRVRRAELEQTYQSLQFEREDGGFEAMLRQAFGEPPQGNSQWSTYVEWLNQQLAEGNTEQTKQEISEVLCMTLEDFDRLIEIKLKNGQSSLETKPTDSEWAELYRILTQSNKVKFLYEQWHRQEQNFEYWRLLKAKLTKWRASMEARQQWQSSLRKMSRQSSIDPDVITDHDLKDCTPHSQPKVLLDRRKLELSQQQRNLQTILEEEKSCSLFGQLLSPIRSYGIAIDKHGNIFVSDNSNHQILKLDPTGQLLDSLGNGGSGLGMLRSPRGIAVGDQGDIFIADRENNRIQKLDSSGNFVAWGGPEPGIEPGQFDLPSGVAINNQGDLYIADTGNHRIQKIDREGNAQVWGGPRPGGAVGEFRNPHGIAVDSLGNVYIADALNHRIQKLDTEGNFTVWGNSQTVDGAGQFNRPRGIWISFDDYIYVADTNNHRIQKFNTEGNFIYQWGVQGNLEGQLEYPFALTVDRSGTIYIADTYNKRIQRLKPNWTLGCEGEGNSQFKYLMGVAIDFQGNILAADTRNNRIQKFNSRGTFIWSSQGPANKPFNNPTSLASDNQGNVYVADTVNHRIVKLDPSGTSVVWSAKGEDNDHFNNPTDVAIDGDGNIYVADRENNRVQKFDSKHKIIWSSLGPTSKPFDSPSRIALDSAGNVYVADTGNNRIQILNSSGDPSQSIQGNGDGGFNLPAGVDVDNSGNIYVSDTYNDRILIFDATHKLIESITTCGPEESSFNRPRGISVDRAGVIYVADSVNHRLTIVGKVAKFNAAIAYSLGTSLASLIKSAKDHDQGLENLASRLAQLNLTMGELQTLIHTHELLAADTLSTDEWDEVCSILVRVKKRRTFAQWRAEEKDSQIILSPDYFQLSDTEPNGIREVRALWSARRDWRDTLSTRIAQEKTTTAAMADVVDSCEASTLPILRDALVNAAGTGEDLSSKAKYLSDRLLIDCQTDSCQKTTRISQALTTLQKLIFSLRTGQLDDTLNLSLTHTENLDIEWQWIGSYETFKAAVGVLLYPETVLLPSLRRQKTPAFRDLLKSLRNNRRLTPQGALDLAETYTEYFNDVGSLSVQVTCVADTRVASVEDKQPFFYMFSLSRLTKKVYWSTYDHANRESTHAQTVWQAVPQLNKVISIVGAVPYELAPNESYVFLFAIREEKQTKELICLKYDLENLTTNRWNNELTILDPPEESKNFEVVVKQSRQTNRPPHLAIRCSDTYTRIYANHLNKDGSGWQEDSWELLVGQTRGAIFTSLLSMVEVETDSFCLICGTSTGKNLDYRIFGALDDGVWRDLHEDVNGIWFRGALTLNFASLPRIYTFFSPIPTGEISYFYKFIQVNNEPGDFSNPPPEERINQINSFDDLNKWLREFLGRDLTDICIHENDFADSTDSNLYLALYSVLINTNYDYLEKSRAIWWFVNEVEESDYLDEVYGDWKILDSWAKKMPCNIQMGELGGLLQHLLNGHKLKIYLRIAKDGSECSDQFLDQIKANRISTTCGSLIEDEFPDNLSYLNIAYSKGIWGSRSFRSFLLLTNEGILEEHFRTEATFDKPFSFHPGSSDVLSQVPCPDLQERKRRVRQFFEYNDLGNGVLPHNIIYLEEAFYFVPTAIALQLQRAGEYTAALDWLRTVYDYSTADNPNTCEEDESEEDERKIYYGLETEQYGADISLDYNWLLDPLDVHRIASIRTNAYTAFTISAIIRCLLAYGDAEFTRDTAESLPNARRLYDTSLDLVPELLSLSTISDQLRSRQPNDNQPLVSRGYTSLSTRSSSAPQTSQRLLSNASLEKNVVQLATRVEQASRAFQTFSMLDLTAEFLEIIDGFITPPNPIFQILGFHPANNLDKIRTCRNIAGVKRQVEAYAAPTDLRSALTSIGAGGQLVLPTRITAPPVPYRYEFLIERSKQLANIAAQMEAAFLAALEKTEAERYSLLKARQDAQLARAGVKLQTLRVRQAEDEVDLAELQQESAEIQFQYYEDWLNEGRSKHEESAINYLYWTVGFYALASANYVGSAAILFASSGFKLEDALNATGQAFSSAGQTMSTYAQIFQIFAAQEYRENEWRLQRDLAQQSIRISDQQIKIANDGVKIVEQERKISEIQVEHAQDILEFLNTKETNAELYDWMNTILEGIYSYFLQQATAMAKLAQSQLAFERQEPPPAFIQADYWEVPSENPMGGATEDTVDRHGLTGTARLLADIYKLDQYRLETEKRKLQLTKTISLARTAPFEFQQFKETGVLPFATPMAMFDRDFPGHYLRLIKRVRTSVIALIPPTEGIKATLSNIGVSRVVVNSNGIFQTRNVTRTPESVALTSPQNATGLFELETQSEMLLPFESLGVDGQWEFRLPKPANPFDYSTIADILITLEYTALDSYDYRKQVIQELDRTLSGDRPFSFKNQFADAWYDLHNPAPDAPMTVHFRTRREDFPPNLSNLKIEHVLLYFARRDGETAEVPTTLKFKPDGGDGEFGGDGESLDGLISTRRGTGSWTLMIGEPPIGEWTLTLSNTEVMQQKFRDEAIEDILLVITYKGETPEWPQ